MTGGQGWGNPDFGGPALRLPAMRSPNYVAGSTGWTINQDGSVEFNNGTFRGTVTAGTFQGTDFVINSSGAFFYSGTPAAGNLIASIASVAGTDAFGNAYLQGAVSYTPNQTWSALIGGQLFLGDAPPGSTTLTDAAALFTTDGSAITALISKTVPAVTTTRLLLEFLSATAGALAVLKVLDQGGTASANVAVSGAALKISADGGTLATWQTVANGGISLGSGWASNTVAGGAQDLQYRLDAEDNLVITGTLHTTSATPAATIFTLPAAYRPAVLQRDTCTSRAAGTTSPNDLSISSSTGAVSLLSNLTASSTDLYINTVVPMGNIA